MDREASFLRCSKLSCYAEFNRMVQVIARVGSSSGGGLRELESANGRTGSGAEYHFYYTLTAMLREVVSNTDPIEQKKDLQKVYSWYSLNKPILKARTKRGQSKPLLYLTANDKWDNRTGELSRPQTAPASLCQELTSGKNEPAFASAYIQRSMMREIRSARPGQPFDELQTTQIQLEPPKARPKSSGSISKRAHPKFSKETERGVIPIVELPSKDMFSEHNHRRPATVPAAISCEQIFNLTSGVAANMVFYKEMKSVRDKFVRRALSAQSTVNRLSPRKPVNSPIDRPQTTKERTRQVEQKEVGIQGKRQQEVASTQPQEQETPSSVAQFDDNSLLLKGKTVIFSETDRSIAMETIPEEQSSSALTANPLIPVSNETKTSHIDSSPKQEKKSLANTPEPERSGSLVSNEQETETTPLSAKVLLKNQLSQSEQEAIQPTIGKNKRVAASVTVTTLTFLKDESRPRTQGRKPQGQLHKHKSRPNSSQTNKIWN